MWEVDEVHIQGFWVVEDANFNLCVFLYFSVILFGTFIFQLWCHVELVLFWIGDGLVFFHYPGLGFMLLMWFFAQHLRRISHQGLWLQHVVRARFLS